MHKNKLKSTDAKATEDERNLGLWRKKRKSSVEKREGEDEEELEREGADQSGEERDEDRRIAALEQAMNKSASYLAIYPSIHSWNIAGPAPF